MGLGERGGGKVEFDNDFYDGRNIKYAFIIILWP